jgi:UDP-N-acetylglucosamine 2-epimerase (non-hydrolysing)
MTDKLENRNIFFYIGTSAELIKLMPVMRRLRESGIDFGIICSGQNDIAKEINLLLLAKAEDTIILQINGKPKKQTPTALFIWFFQTCIKGFFAFLRTFSRNENRRNNAWILVHGDTLSTIQGAVLGKVFGFKVGHIEAGLRSFNLLHPFPEEIDRVITSYFVDAHFCPNDWAIGNLKKHNGKKINTLQNTLIESLQIAMEQKGPFPIPEILGEKYFVFVMHRQENLLNLRLVDLLIKEFLLTLDGRRCVFILHDYTRYVLRQRGLLEKLQQNKNILLIPRLPYIDFMQILDASEFIITDGGSNQEECYYFGKPTLLLRNVTERIEGLGENVIISKNEEQIIRDFILNYKKHAREPIIGMFSPSEVIVSYIQNH